MKPLVEFYDNLLASLSCHIDDATREVSAFYDGEYSPVYVKKKQMMAINHSLVKNGFSNPDKQVAFHPLSESTAATTMSDVHQWLLIAIRVRLNQLFAMTAARILTVALSPEIQSKLRPTEIAQYKSLTDIDQKTLQTLNSIIDNVDMTNSNRSLVHMRVKRNGQLNGKSYGRVAYITFPILNELKEATDTVFDVKVRKKDIVSLRLLLEEVMLNGKGSDLGDFSAANTTMVAPTLSAMLTAYYNVLLRFNSLAKSHGKVLEPAGIPVDISWYPCISDFDKLRNMVPPLDGNIGFTPSKNEDEDGITFKEREPVEDSPASVTGINTAVEMTKEQPASTRHSFLKAKAITGGINLHHPVVNPNDPLAITAASNTFDPESLSPEEYAVWRMRQQAQGGYNATGQQDFLRGRDMFVQQQQQQRYGMPLQAPVQSHYQTHMQPAHQQPSGMRVMGYTPDGKQIVDIGGKIVEMIPAEQATMQPAGQGMPASGPGAWARFAK